MNDAPYIHPIYGYLPKKPLKNEFEIVIKTKTLYDKTFPDNQKELTPDELMDIAAARLFDKYSQPPDDPACPKQPYIQ